MLKLHLIDLLSICYTSKFATNMVKSRTDGAYALVYRTYMVDRRRRNRQYNTIQYNIRLLVGLT